MEFLHKMAFYIMFGIGCLIILYLLLASFSLLIDPYSKKIEVLILLIGASIFSVGLYKAYYLIQSGEQYIQCCKIMGIVWGVALGVILGLEVILFFNSPLK